MDLEIGKIMYRENVVGIIKSMRMRSNLFNIVPIIVPEIQGHLITNY